jgi:hypothetical protein
MPLPLYHIFSTIAVWHRQQLSVIFSGIASNVFVSFLYLAYQGLTGTTLP